MWYGRRYARDRVAFELQELIRLKEIMAAFERQPILTAKGRDEISARLLRLEDEIALCRQKLEQESVERRRDRALADQRMNKLQVELTRSATKPPATSN